MNSRHSFQCVSDWRGGTESKELSGVSRRFCSNSSQSCRYVALFSRTFCLFFIYLKAALTSVYNQFTFNKHLFIIKPCLYWKKCTQLQRFMIEFNIELIQISVNLHINKLLDEYLQFWYKSWLCRKGYWQKRKGYSGDRWQIWSGKSAHRRRQR